jgi:hypothetical protein
VTQPRGTAIGMDLIWAVNLLAQITEASYDKELLGSSPSALPREKAKVLTQRTGWHLTWDVRRSKVEIDEGHNKPKWSLDVVELPANVQDIIAEGGLGKWVKSQINATT